MKEIHWAVTPCFHQKKYIMKKNSLILIGLLIASTINAQSISDALLFSQSEIQGTARFRALSGSFGALGGDMSALSLNPAGSAVFNQSHAAFTFSNLETNSDTRYFDGRRNSNASNFDVNQGGGAFVFASNNGSPWRKFTLAITYDKTNNYEDNWLASGNNTNNDGNFSNSIASYFYDYANGVELQDLLLLDNETVNQAYGSIGSAFGFTTQQAFLGYWSYILDPVNETNDNNTAYNATVNSGNFHHDYAYFSSGFNGKITFNFAAQYEDNLYIGLNLNSHFIDYQRSTSLFETNSNGGLISSIDFENTLATIGSGFSFQLGSIFKVNPEFRIGFTYDSPTWYAIDEETTQFLDTNELVNRNEATIGTETLNVHPRYRLQTPSKISGSLAYVFGNRGLISFDYSRKDYGKTKFKPESDDFYSIQNSLISTNLTNASTYRAGGEYKIKQWRFRGGYRFEESPYKDGVTVGDLTGFSLGFGINFGNTNLDLTYDESERSFETPLYDIGLIETTSIDRKNSNLTLSLSFNI